MITNHDLDLIGPAVVETPPTPPCPDPPPPPGTASDEPEGEPTPAG